MTRFSFYDHDATQSECAHRLSATSSWNVGGPFTFLCVISAGIIFARAPPFRLALPKSALPSPSSLTFIPTIFFYSMASQKVDMATSPAPICSNTKSKIFLTS